jgi:DNA-binding beta-propeller fold protein YncE
MTRALFCIAALLCPVAACLAPEETEPAVVFFASSVGSTVAYESGTGLVWLTSPDDDRVVAIDGDSLAQVRTYDAPDEPSHLAIMNGSLLVTATHDHRLMYLGPESAQPVNIPTPCGATRGVAWLDVEGTRALVTCPWDDRVLVVNTRDGRVTGVFTSPTRPTAVAVTQGMVYVTSSAEGMLYSVRADSLYDSDGTSLRPLGWQAQATQHATDRQGTQLDALTITSRGVSGVMQIVDNDFDRTRTPEDGGYGQVEDGDPRIEPFIVGSCAGRYALFDGGERIFSGPSAIAEAPEANLWVLNEYTQNLTRVLCAGQPSTTEWRAVGGQWQIGGGARGLAINEDRTVVWVDVGFDHAVSRLQVLPDGTEVSFQTVRREPGPMEWSDAALQGRRHFSDATDTHLTPSGVVACATCHPASGEDGLAWFIHTTGIERKFRRTPTVRSMNTAIRPLHWDGEYTEFEALFADTVTELMGGDALVIDPATLAAFLQEWRPIPGRPLLETEQAVAAQGQTLFTEVGCAGCHSGDRFTDGLAHAIAPESDDPDGALALVFTPSLTGVRARAPFFHDARFPNLFESIAQHPNADGTRYDALLDIAELRALTLYLETL